MIINKENRKIISEKEKYADSIISQARGLMFSKRKNLVMVFPRERKVRLHSWFVFFPIEVLVVDTSRKIVEIKKRFKPFGFWRAEKRGKYIIELGEKGKEEYKIGDKLVFKS